MKVPQSMWDFEQRHPWLSTCLYFAAVFGSILVCHWMNGGFE